MPTNADSPQAACDATLPTEATSRDTGLTVLGFRSPGTSLDEIRDELVCRLQDLVNAAGSEQDVVFEIETLVRHLAIDLLESNEFRNRTARILDEIQFEAAKDLGPQAADKVPEEIIEIDEAGKVTPVVYPSSFAVGDHVRLKSGGPKMTVLDVLSDGRLHCQWQGGSQATFDPAVVDAVPVHEAVKSDEPTVASAKAEIMENLRNPSQQARSPNAPRGEGGFLSLP